MASALETFASVFRGQVTDELLKSAHTDSQGRVYYDDFLGDGDRDANNKTIVSVSVLLITHWRSNGTHFISCPFVGSF